MINYDTLIIGAGPAGCAAGTILAENGRKVLVIERDKFPRYHIGESLLPFTHQPLKRLGLVEKMRQSCFVKKYSVIRKDDKLYVNSFIKVTKIIWNISIVSCGAYQQFAGSDKVSNILVEC